MLIEELISIANVLDDSGFKKQADEIDILISQASDISPDVWKFIDTLKYTLKNEANNGKLNSIVDIDRVIDQISGERRVSPERIPHNPSYQSLEYLERKNREELEDNTPTRQVNGIFAIQDNMEESMKEIAKLNNALSNATDPDQIAKIQSKIKHIKSAYKEDLISLQRRTDQVNSMIANNPSGFKEFMHLYSLRMNKNKENVK